MYHSVSQCVMQIAAPNFYCTNIFDMHSRTMRSPVVPTITPLYLSKFTDFCAATQHIFFY